MAKLLVWEEDHLMRWSLERALGRDGHVVCTVIGGKAIIDAVKDGEYRVVLTDYGSSEPEGFDALRMIKAHSPHTHVIVVTAKATPRMERLARNMGAFDFFDKPFELIELKQAVQRAIVTPERRKGPRGCCGGCEWQRPCDRMEFSQRVRSAT